jgi:hypothetical protein
MHRISMQSSRLLFVQKLGGLSGGLPQKIMTAAQFTLRSIFSTARIKLVPVPLFWFLNYLFS